MGLFPTLATIVFVAALLPVSTRRQTQSGTVTGILRTSAGGPLEGVRVAVMPAGDDALGDTVLESIALTDSDGRYRLENVSPGRYHVVAGRVGALFYHPGVTEPTGATAILVVAGQTIEVPDMVFRRTNVTGRVVDAITGAARRVESLTLCCGRVPVPSSAFAALTFVTPVNPTAVSMFSAQVREDGTFLFTSVPPGNYYIRAADAGIVTIAQPLALGMDDVTGLEIKVTAGVDVRGHISDRLGQPVPGLVLSLTPHPENASLEAANPSPAASMISAASTTDVLGLGPPPLAEIRRILSVKPRTAPTVSDGTFSFRGVLPGRYVLQMHAPGGPSFSREIEVSLRESLNVQLDVPFTQVTGRIVMGDDGASPSLSGSVRFVSSDPEARIIFGFPGNDGRFSMLLAPGEYRLFTENLNTSRHSIQSISDGAADLLNAPFVFDGSRHLEIRITLAP